jgi:hypothetical protein
VSREGARGEKNPDGDGDPEERFEGRSDPDQKLLRYESAPPTCRKPSPSRE